MRSLFFFSPYPLPAHRLGVRFFRDCGFEIVGDDTFECRMSLDIPAIRPEDIVTRLAYQRETLRPLRRSLHKLHQSPSAAGG